MQESWPNLPRGGISLHARVSEAEPSIAIQLRSRARSRITYASPHIEILIRGNCESLFPSCVPRIHDTSATLIQKDHHDRLEEDLRSPPFPRKFYGNFGDTGARNRIPSRWRNSMTLFIPELPTSNTTGRTNYANSVT